MRGVGGFIIRGRGLHRLIGGASSWNRAVGRSAWSGWHQAWSLAVAYSRIL